MGIKDIYILHGTCFGTYIAKGSSSENCIKDCVIPESVVETVKDTHHTSSSRFCKLVCTTILCSKLSTKENKEKRKKIPGFSLVLSFEHKVVAHLQKVELLLWWASLTVSTIDSGITQSLL
ncbi:hypothetical protein V6Z11_D07G018600 [Gossypium hirsutum]